MSASKTAASSAFTTIREAKDHKTSGSAPLFDLIANAERDDDDSVGGSVPPPGGAHAADSDDDELADAMKKKMAFGLANTTFTFTKSKSIKDKDLRLKMRNTSTLQVSDDMIDTGKDCIRTSMIEAVDETKNLIESQHRHLEVDGAPFVEIATLVFEVLAGRIDDDPTGSSFTPMAWKKTGQKIETIKVRLIALQGVSGNNGVTRESTLAVTLNPFCRVLNQTKEIGLALLSDGYKEVVTEASVSGKKVTAAFADSVSALFLAAHLPSFYMVRSVQYACGYDEPAMAGVVNIGLWFDRQCSKARNVIRTLDLALIPKSIKAAAGVAPEAVKAQIKAAVDAAVKVQVKAAVDAAVAATNAKNRFADNATIASLKSQLSTALTNEQSAKDAIEAKGNAALAAVSACKEAQRAGLKAISAGLAQMLFAHNIDPKTSATFNSVSQCMLAQYTAITGKAPAAKTPSAAVSLKGAPLVNPTAAAAAAPAPAGDSKKAAMEDDEDL